MLLTFRPLVLGDGGIRLRAMQEVSELTRRRRPGASRASPIPALTTRRAAATLELKSGQSFAMAGLLRSTDAAVTSRIPGLGDLPVIGPLFRSVRYRNEETELVILVTASLVEPMSVASAPPLPGVTHQAPNDWEFYVEGRIEGKEPARIDPASQKWLRRWAWTSSSAPAPGTPTKSRAIRSPPVRPRRTGRPRRPRPIRARRHSQRGAAAGRAPAYWDRKD